MKRGILFVLALLLLAISFFLLDEKKENQTEISVWDLDIDEIEYVPPKSSWNAEDSASFFRWPIIFKKEKEISESGNFSSVGSVDSETGETISFEGGHNVDNLFRELSVLKVKGLERIAPGELTTSLMLGDDSPVLILKSSGRTLKRIWIGKKKSSDATRILREGEEIFIVPNHILDRLTRGIGEFRQKQLVVLKDESILETVWEEEGKTLRLDNHPFKEQSIKKNFWRRLSGKIIALENHLGDAWNSQIIGQKVDVYPDDPSGAGFAVAKKLTSVPAEASLKIRISNGDWIVLRYYPKTNIHSVDYRPVIRIVNGKFSEPPFYIREDSFLRLKENVANLDKAEAKKAPVSPEQILKNHQSAIPKK
ncbi:hypothetical protein EHQ12_08355 [Leptospira gomenensis]|uniref:DUF4340 domain-containing protein n=1 Tax=Leptospira gomenensis TaxID=2484974 RepID=A0A5F1Z3Z1_9LEPT|nr:hypothetical protein [Leptospira gomenensis]TGK35932.1 hypothetical protein EHQ17_04935 [Leptospira gomenensis]TGK40036.1 hypothetical protein EHQ12_08355 [Leptospira gomenensis]TGK51486.1 hypothetical protein EHQ07_02750 [Leptospira gomenensis]TGK68043.1 hypothetical protein EHQ13_01280 [Leptospira gomenensis]